MNNQAFSKIWVVIILIILITGGIFAWQYFGAPEETKVLEKEAVKDETKDETADWKTYRNEEYGFEVKYPGDWQLDLRGAPSSVRFDVNKDNFLTKKEFRERLGNEYTYRWHYYRWKFYDDIEIKVYVSLNELPGNVNNLDLEKWIEKRMEDYLISKNSKKEITVNKYKGIEVKELGYGSYRSIFLLRNSFIYNFFLDAYHPEMDIFNQMLSTFRFIRPLAK